MDKSHTPTQPSSSDGSLNLPPDTPDWVRDRLQKLLDKGMLLPEEILQALLTSPEQAPRVLGQDYEQYLSSLTGNAQAVQPDISPEQEEGIPLLDPQPKPTLRLED